MTDGCRTYLRHRSVSLSILHRRDDRTDLAHAFLDGACVDQHAGSILVARVIARPPASFKSGSSSPICSCWRLSRATAPSQASFSGMFPIPVLGEAYASERSGVKGRRIGA